MTFSICVVSFFTLIIMGDIGEALSFPIPTSSAEVRLFLSLVGFYRHMITDFETIVEPLAYLLRPNVHFIWTVAQEDAFCILSLYLLVLMV